MRIAIASGKGGTGKTMVTSSLAACWNAPVTAVDLDVEEPNLHLFLRPEITGSREASIEVPVVDEGKCIYCRECADFCQYKAISVLDKVIMLFPEMCHGCGGCIAACPADALSPGKRVLGDIFWGNSGSILFLEGRLRVGEAMSPPLIREVVSTLERSGNFDASTDVLLDSPPGVSCPAVSAVMSSDLILLVTEPTPFGLFDLRLAYQAFSPLKKPMGVVINRSGVGNDDVYRYCRDEGLPVLAEIPYDRTIAEAYAAGEIIAEISGEMKSIFSDLAAAVAHAVNKDAEARHA